MTQQVKAIRIDANGGPDALKLTTVDLPPPGIDEVTIRQKAVGLNFLDIYFRSGLYKHPLPHGIGCEASGVVEAVGADVRHLKVGDRVAYGQSSLGAYAEARNVPAQFVVKLPQAINRLQRFDAVVIDDIGYVQQSREEMEVLFHFLAERYEKKSVVITSNLVFSQWDQIFKDPMTTMAAVDRLVHHSTIVEFTGESHRATAAKANGNPPAANTAAS